MSAQPISERTTFRSWLADNWKALLTVWVISLLPFLPVLFAGEILFSSDQIAAPSWRWYFEALRGGEIPLWNPYGLGGMPTFDAMFGDSAYPSFLLLGFLLPVTHVVTYNFVLHVLIAGFTAYLLSQRYFRIPSWFAVPLALAWALNPHFISYVYGGHTGKFHIMAWLPLGVYFLLRSLGRSAAWYHLVGLALTTALFVITTHLQFTYYVMMGYFLVWIYFLIPALREKRFGEAGSVAVRFWIPLFLGVGLAFFIFYPPMQYTKEFGVRGSAEKTTYEHATSWSIHPEEAVSLLVPEFGGLNEKYWGRNPFKLNTEAPGTLVWFMGLFGLLAFRKNRWYWLWGSVGLLAVIFGLAAHTPIFRLFYEFVPGIKNFRAASMMLFWLSMALLLMTGETLRRLMAVGSDALSDAKRELIRKRLVKWGTVVAAILAFLGLAPGVAYGVWGFFVEEASIPNIGAQVAAQSGFALGAFRVSALVALLTWGTAVFLLRQRRPASFAAVLLAVVVIDTYWVNTNYIQGYRVERTLTADPVVNYLQTDTDRYRVFGVPGAWERWYSQYHGIETADGWTDNETRIYREYRGGDYQRNPNLFENLQQNPDGTVGGNVFLDMLNVKYLVFRVPNDPGLKLTMNTTVLPRARFVPRWESIPEELAIARMKEPDFDPRRVALVDSPAGENGGTDLAEDVRVVPREVSRSYNRQVYSVETPSEGLLVVADLWFPHWRATVNGRDVPVLRTNFAFRGVKLEPGTNEVVFEYHSPWLRRGFLVCLASAIGVALLAFVWARFGRRTV